MNEVQDKKDFEVMDVRGLKANFLPALLKKAEGIAVNSGLCVIQSFEPIPLYTALGELGFTHETEQVADDEYRVYFLRTQQTETEGKKSSKIPFKPTAIVNFNTIDPKLADKVVNFWEYIWAKENPALDMKTRLLLSLANGVGAGRMRQAVREFIKAYSLGVSTEEFDEVFAMFAWNQGVGFFASEIGPSALFGAYRLVKSLEDKGEDRKDIVKQLTEKFGDKNPEVATFFSGKKG